MALGADMVTVGGEKPISDLVTVVHGMKTTEKQQMLGSQEGSDTGSRDREQGNQMVHEKKKRNEATTLKTDEPALAIWTTQNQISPNRSNQIRPNETTPATTDQFSRARADGTKQNETTPATVAQFSTTEASWTKQNQIGPTSAGQISPNEPTPATTDQFSVSKTNRTKQKETIPASTDWTKQKWTVSVSTSLTSLASTNPSMPASPPQTPPVPINEQRTPWTSPKAMPASQATTKNSVHSPMASGQSHHLGIIVAAVIIGILILVVLLIAALHCRRRHRSGSTSFNAGRAGSGEWAGPVMLPEEKGGGQAEDGGQEAKPDGSRRPTLTTFFGKRHSRVSSVAMEDMAGEKNESPLSEPLLATGEQQADPAPPGGVETPTSSAGPGAPCGGAPSLTFAPPQSHRGPPGPKPKGLWATALPAHPLRPPMDAPHS
uniref:Uncharacterized protein n=1 Tax=Pelusios castaneus TaxID=367368 RepID=A0A8C8S3L2_9SAUR